MFQGFSQQTLDFLWGIRFNNERGWFEEHKQDYLQYLYGPMQQLGAAVYDRMREEFPRLQLNLHVCRIYRDARRLHGRGPYKDHLWFTLREEDEGWACRPVFWFEIGPEDYNYGLGCYSASPEGMEALRRAMDAAPAAMERLQRRLQRQKRFLLEGPEYARPRPAASPLLQEWYQKKSFALTCQRPHDELEQSPKLAEELAEAFTWLMPYYRYFRRSMAAEIENFPVQEES